MATNLFKNNFNIDSISSIEYNIIIGPDGEAPFKLWEYDIYINGEKVGSSLIDLDEYNYQFNKKWEVNWRWTLQSGQAFTPILGYYVQKFPESPEEVFRTIPGSRNSGRYKPYNRYYFHYQILLNHLYEPSFHLHS